MGAAKVYHRTKREIRWFGTWQEVEEVVVHEGALTFTAGAGVIEALRLPGVGFTLHAVVRDETHAYADVARFALILATSIKFVGDN